MVHYCTAYGCKSKAKKGEKISFHKFPVDSSLLKKWLIAMKRDKFIPTKYSKLCSYHFNDDDFVWNFGLKTLKKNVIPSVFNFPKHLQTISKPRTTRTSRKENLLITPTLTSPSISTSVNAVVAEKLSVPSTTKDLANENEAPTSSDISTSLNAVVAEELPVPSTSKDFENENAKTETLPIMRKRKRSQPVYMGDFSIEDLKSPHKVELMWKIAQNTINRKNKRISYLETRVKRLNRKVSTLSDLIKHLKEERKIL